MAETTRDRRVAGEGAGRSARFLGDDVPGRGELRPHPRPARVGRRGARRRSRRSLGPARRRHRRRLHARTTSSRPTRRSTSRRLKAALKDASEVLLATDPDREGESISWHLHGGAQAEGPGPAASSSTRSPRRRSARRSTTPHDVEREPGARAGEPPHSRSAVRLHAVAGAVEEGADRAERRPRAERRRPPDRRARRRTARVPHRRSTGISRRSCAARAASSPRRWRASATSASPPARTSTRDGRARVGNGARCSTKPTARALVDGARSATCRGR